MSYQIKFLPEALTELKQLPSYVRAIARDYIDELAIEPRQLRARELQGKPGTYRLWVAGRWRMVYAIDDETLIVT